jgi:Glycosyl hydrolase catalytic core
MERRLDRRKFLTLAALAAPGAILAANTAAAVPAQAATPALKGIGYSNSTALARTQIKSLNVAWHYNWEPYCNLTTPAFTPMVKNAKRLLEDNAIGKIMSQLPQTRAKNLLGFNEPDYASQANMSVDKAISLWPQLQKTGMRLGAPATVNVTSPWLKDFMAKAKRKGLRVDFMTMHCYGWPNVESFLEKVNMLHDLYGKPIWVTEYAVADFEATSTRRSRYSRAQTEDFMRGTVAGMRAMPYVERFAWKTRATSDPKMGNSALFSADGSRTSTGRLYASL